MGHRPELLVEKWASPQTTQRARYFDMAAILDLNNAQNARKIASNMAKDT